MFETFQKYSNFDRKASRSEFWGVSLTLFGLSFLLGIVSVGLMAAAGTFGLIVGLPMLIAGIVIFTWVSVATIVARCRDAGINPWFTLACVIPYIGTIVMIVIGCLRSKE
jgi:uncharacterized membrane protein YhaH (DUF805 family)